MKPYGFTEWLLRENWIVHRNILSPQFSIQSSYGFSFRRCETLIPASHSHLKPAIFCPIKFWRFFFWISEPSSCIGYLCLPVHQHRYVYQDIIEMTMPIYRCCCNLVISRWCGIWHTLQWEIKKMNRKYWRSYLIKREHACHGTWSTSFHLNFQFQIWLWLCDARWALYLIYRWAGCHKQPNAHIYCFCVPKKREQKIDFQSKNEKKAKLGKE